MSVNGADFTLGQIEPQFLPIPDGLDLTYQACTLEDGERTIFTYFKGPLVIADSERGAASVLYHQDPAHHREIPQVISGRQFYWLALAVDGRIVATDQESWEAVGAHIEGWKGNVPYPMLEELQDAPAEPPKGEQIDGLWVLDGNLPWVDQPLSVSIDGGDLDREFLNAQVCEHAGE